MLISQQAIPQTVVHDVLQEATQSATVFPVVTQGLFAIVQD
jgi:hypothetical protein